MKTHHFDRYSLGLLCLPTLLPPLGVSAALFDRVVETKYGPVQGIAAFSSAPAGNISGWQNVGVWKGVPYAATTAGANRWRPPQYPVSWTETLDSSVFGPACPESQGDSATVSEDCLNLNIWSNANSTDDKLPVIMWSHPAGSAGSDALFDGGGMAAKGVVFVTINYRDGAFGWLAHPQLSAEMYDETGSNSSGNWGMLDQFAALKWIQANIAAFGGDPELITTAGQSAGSAAAYHMVNSLLVKGIPKRAIAESGVRDPHDPEAGSLAESYNNQTTAYALGEAFLTANGATSITELRAIPLAELNDTASAPGSGGGFRATLDYYAMPATYATSLSRPPVNDIPFITGNTKDESGASTTTNLTVAQYVADMQAQYGPFNLSAAALDLYPAVNASQADASYNRHWQDTSRVSSWGYARGWYLGGAKSHIYTYFWDHAPPGQTQGAYHESEINYVLNNLYATDKPWEALDYAIAAKMSAYWANFAATGDPNLGGYYYSGDGNDDGEPLVTWNPTLGNETITMRLGNGWAPIPIAEPAQIAFLDEYFSEQTPY